MIQPFSCVCLLLAAGSGLYLYDAKHRTEVLDHQIADVLTQVDMARARTATLKADYAALSEPDRLTALATRYLALGPTTPTQFVPLAALDARLPPVQSFPKPGDVPMPVAPPSPANTTDGDGDGDGNGGGGGDGPAEPGPVAAAVPVAAADPVPAPQAAHPALAAAAPSAAPHPLLAAARPVAHRAPAALAEPQYATTIHPTQMPLASPRPVASRLLATAALRPIGPGRPRLTQTSYSPAYAPSSVHRTYPRAGSPSASPSGNTSGSVLGGAEETLPPPVPIAN